MGKTAEPPCRAPLGLPGTSISLPLGRLATSVGVPLKTSQLPKLTWTSAVAAMPATRRVSTEVTWVAKTSLVGVTITVAVGFGLVAVYPWLSSSSMLNSKSAATPAVQSKISVLV